MNTLNSLLRLTTLAGLLAVSNAFAATMTDTMNVSAVVENACSNLTANDIDFGSDAPRDVEDDQTAVISVTCNNGTPYTVELDYGVNTNGMVTRRVAGSDTAEFMTYTLFKPTAAGAGATAAVWGTNALEAGSAFTSTGTGAAQSLTATGRLSRVQGSSPDMYTDLITVTLTY